MLRTPNKVKHFTWRACHNSLPTMDNLFHRHITPSACCNTCQTQTEDILHVVWGCPEVANLWSTINWTQHTIPHSPGDFANLFLSFLQVRDDYRVEIFAISAWLLWNQRNSIHFRRPTRPLNQIFTEAARLLQDFLDAHDDAPVIVRNSVQPKWSVPTLPRYKANFDGALFKSTNSAGLGVVIRDTNSVVIRDTNSVVIGALSARVPLPQSVAMVEALACRRAVQFAVEIGLHDVIFEGDAAVVINAISKGLANQSLYGHLVDDILGLASHLRFSEFCFVPRSCNAVADALAKRAKVGLDLLVWLEDCPEDITPLVLDDAS